MKRERWRSPSVRSTLPFLVMIVVFLVAAHWQWQRAEFKQAREAEFARAQNQDSLRTLATALSAPSGSFERVRVEGTLDTARVILLDNRLLDGQYGVDVYVPVRADGNGTALLNLGWVAADRARRSAPVVPMIPERIDTIALLIDPPSAGLALGADTITRNPKFPLLLSRIDIPLLRTLLDQPDLAERVVIPLPDDSTSFRRSWQLPGIAADRHRGYALQWLSFAIGTLVFFILWHRPRKDIPR